MKANYSIDAGDVRVIRPLIYVRENATRDFAKSARLPVINENCPACFEEPKERARVKKILQQEEAMVPALFFNLRKAMLPLMHEKTYSVFKDIETEIENSSSARVVVKRSRNTNDAAFDNDSDALLANDHHDRADLSSKKLKQEPSSNVCTDDYCAPCFELL